MEMLKEPTKFYDTQARTLSVGLHPRNEGNEVPVNWGYFKFADRWKCCFLHKKSDGNTGMSTLEDSDLLALREKVRHLRW
jgi:hypothetical protein